MSSGKGKAGEAKPSTPSQTTLQWFATNTTAENIKAFYIWLPVLGAAISARDRVYLPFITEFDDVANKRKPLSALKYPNPSSYERKIDKYEAFKACQSPSLGGGRSSKPSLEFSSPSQKSGIKLETEENVNPRGEDNTTTSAPAAPAAMDYTSYSRINKSEKRRDELLASLGVLFNKIWDSLPDALKINLLQYDFITDEDIHDACHPLDLLHGIYNFIQSPHGSLSGNPEIQHARRLRKAQQELGKYKQGYSTPQDHHIAIRNHFAEIQAAGGSESECSPTNQVDAFILKLHPKAYAEARLLWQNAVTHNRIEALLTDVTLREAEHWASTLTITATINGRDRTMTCMEYHEHLKSAKPPSKPEAASVNVASSQDNTSHTSATQPRRKGKNNKGNPSNHKSAAAPPTPCAIKKPNGKPCGGAHWHNECTHNPKSNNYHGPQDDASGNSSNQHALVSQQREEDDTFSQSSFHDDEHEDELDALHFAMVCNGQPQVNQDATFQLRQAIGVPTTTPSSSPADDTHDDSILSQQSSAAETPLAAVPQPFVKRRQTAAQLAITEAQDWLQRTPTSKLNLTEPWSDVQSSDDEYSSDEEDSNSSDTQATHTEPSQGHALVARAAAHPSPTLPLSAATACTSHLFLTHKRRLKHCLDFLTFHIELHGRFKLREYRARSDIRSYRVQIYHKMLAVATLNKMLHRAHVIDPAPYASECTQCIYHKCTPTKLLNPVSPTLPVCDSPSLSQSPSCDKLPSSAPPYFFRKHLQYISFSEIDNLVIDNVISLAYGAVLKRIKLKIHPLPEPQPVLTFIPSSLVLSTSGTPSFQPDTSFDILDSEAETETIHSNALCPALSTSGQTSPPSSIIFDSAASISICNDQALFDGPLIRASTPMDIIGIHGHKMSATHFGFLPGFGNLRFWYLPGADYTLVSSSRAHDHGYPHTRDNTTDAYIIHMPDHDVHFTRTKGGLYMVNLHDLVTQRANPVNAHRVRPTQQELEAQLDKQADRLPFRCPICGGRSSTKQAFNQHKCTGTPLKEHVAAAPPSRLTPSSTSPTEPVYTDALIKKIANVADKKKEFSSAEVKEAERARSISQSLGHSSLTALLRVVDTQSFANLGITSQGVRRAAYIFGENPHYLQGNTTASPPSRDKRTFQPRDAIPIEQQIQHCQFDLFFIEGTKYILMFLEPLGYVITQSIERKTQDEIGRYIIQHLSHIRKQGFEVTNIKTDGEPALKALAPVFVRLHELEVDRLGAGDHAPRAERAIRKVKEVVRSTLHSLPYRLPVALLPHLVAHATRILNFIPTKDSKVSPYTRFTGKIPNFKTELRHNFGEFAMISTPHTSNTMHARATYGILLESSGNTNGSVFCFNLETLRIMSRQHWKSLPTPESVINFMDALAAGKQPSPLVSNASLKLSKDKKRVELHPDEDDDDSVTSPPNDTHIPPTIEAIRGPNANRPHSPIPLPITSGLSTSDIQDIPSFQLHTPSTRRGAPAIAGGGGADLSSTRAHRGASTNTTAGGDRGHTLSTSAHRGVLPDDGTNTYTSTPKATAGGGGSQHQSTSVKSSGGTTTPRPRGRPRKQHPEDSAHTQGAVFASTVNVKSTSQMSLKQALRDHPTQTQAAVTAEIKQLLEKKVFHPIQRRNLTPEQNKSILPSSCFIKHKFLPDSTYEKCKARLVAGGHRQDRSLYDDVSSPTVKSQSVLMVAALAATENRYKATVDVSGAYLHAPITSVRVFVRLEPTIAQILVKLDPSYKPFLTAKNEIIVELDRALYGCVESARAWYNLLTSYLMDYGFAPNPFDKCVFNLISDSGAQLTICVHVDDLFITCRSYIDLHAFINALNRRFSGCNIHTRGPYNYIGMTLEFLTVERDGMTSGSVKVSQVKLINEILNDVGSIANRATPASESLFNIADGTLKLANKEREVFHSRVAKLLYLAKHSRPDILLAVSFLTTRVKQPDEADAEKLARLIGYISATKDRCLILDGSKGKVIAHVDASFAVHPEMQSHTGIVISIGNGAVFAKSSKQRLVTKSSTEAELVGISDAIGYIIWTRNWMIAQGYSQEPATLYQDNQSTIVLAHKGHTSGERTRHINIRYFFIMDRIKNGEVNVKYLHTSQMTADGGSKPLQGRNFYNFVKAILNL